MAVPGNVAFAALSIKCPLAATNVGAAFQNNTGAAATPAIAHVTRFYAERTVTETKRPGRKSGRGAPLFHYPGPYPRPDRAPDGARILSVTGCSGD